jgi:hypothetical protein
VGWQDGTASGSAMKDRTFNAVSQRILPGQTGRRGNGRWDGKSSFGSALVSVRVAVGGRRGGAVLCAGRESTDAGPVALTAGRCEVGRRLPAHPLVGLTRVRPDGVLLADGGPRAPGAWRDAFRLRSGTGPFMRPCAGGHCGTEGGVRGSTRLPEGGPGLGSE